MGTDLRFEFKVDLKPVSHKSYRYYMKKLAHEPKLRQYLIFAYQIKDMLDPSTRPPSSALLRVNPEQSSGIEKESNITLRQIAE